MRTFTVQSMSYDEYADSMTVQVVNAEQNLERFRIDLDFSSRAQAIVDTSDDTTTAYVANTDLSYSSKVLSAFVARFADAYAACEHDASPADVSIESFDVDA